MNNQFSENLKKIRKENNLSQEQLADELGVSRQAISKWESAVAYPEMDKIIALCEKFNLNIDDLLHKDIKEVKGEEESKKRINKGIDDFLGFITSTINMFSNMNFKSKMKCLFEQLIIALALFLASMLIYCVLDSLLGHLIAFLPFKVYHFVLSLLDSILVIALLIVSIIIITHIFKTRYLDYYEKIKDEFVETNDDNKKNDEVVNNDKVEFKKDDNKIIIRDPKHSEYRFLNNLFKFIVGIIKFFALFFSFFVAFVLICLFVTFIASFLLYKTGFLFAGILLAILLSSIIIIVILLLLLNFIFNRKNDKKKMIWSFISSLIVLGIGGGMILIGSISFDVIENDKSILKTVTKEYDMKDDLLIYPHYDYEVEYVISDNTNVKIEYTFNKYCEIDDYHDENTIVGRVYCENPIEIARAFIKNANDKKILLMDDHVEKMVVYTNQNNIEKLKKNWSNHLEKEKQNDEERTYYDNRIEELEEQNNKLQQQIFDLQENMD